MKKQIKKYEDSCNEIVKLFCEKQDLKFEGWVDGQIGETAWCDDYAFNMHDIVLDLKHNMKAGEIVDWYNSNDYSADRHINYRSYIKGLRVSDLDPY